MDETHFDDLVRALAGGAPRRLLLRLSALPLAGGLAAFLVDDDESEAKNKKRRRKKKRKRKKRRKRKRKKRKRQNKNKAACNGADVCASGCPFSSVQAAIDAASSGENITLCAETFTGNLTISKDLTLAGAGEDGTTLQGDGTPFTTAVAIAAGTVRIENLRITGGTGDFGGGISNAAGATLQVAGCTITGNTCENFGGGIYNEGTLTVEDCTISENVPDADGDLWGGAIYSNSASPLTVTNSALTGNQANRGGGLYAEGGGPVTLTGCDISDNETFAGFTSAGGGAIYFTGDAGLEGTDCTLRDNTTDGAGGAAHVDATAVFTNCEISGNSASTGGGIHNGGFSDSDSDLTLNNTDVTGNFAFSVGGGIYNQGTLALEAGATVSDNAASFDGGGIYNTEGTSTCDGSSSVSGNTEGIPPTRPSNCVAFAGGSCGTC